MIKRERLTKFYKDNYNQLVSNYTKRTGSVEDAEDVVQEAFTRALTYLDRYNESEPFSNWMTRVVYNTFCTWKKEKDSMGLTYSFDEEYYDPIDGNLQRKQLVEGIIRLMNGCSERDQQILNMYYCCNYKAKDVATIMSLPKHIVWGVTEDFRGRIKALTA